MRSICTFFTKISFAIALVLTAIVSVLPSNANTNKGETGSPVSPVPRRESGAGLALTGTSAASIAARADLEQSYRRAWELLRDNTMYPERLANWRLWEHKFDGKLSGEKDLERAVNQMLRVLDDQYTYFRTTGETQNRNVGDAERSVVVREMLDKSYGYICIKTFSSRHVAEEVQLALQELAAAQSYILDLRDNRGGYVDQALLCFSAMVDQGKFVSIQGRQSGADYREEVSIESNELVRVINGIEAREPRLVNMTGAKPIIVLVNSGTRSASEMLAGALRDVRNARLIGTKTFGKGVVQGTWQLDSGCSIKIAMARFYLPGGANINGKGISPDVVAEFDGETEDNPTDSVSNGLPSIPWKQRAFTSAVFGSRLLSIGAESSR